MHVQLELVNNQVRFKGTGEDSNTVSIDGADTIGGSGSGLRPMELLLLSLASCTAMDFVTIIRKQRQDLTAFRVHVDGKRIESQIPAVFESIHLHFDLSGKLDAGKVQRALDLSLYQYCSVQAMLQPKVQITADFSIQESV